MPKTSASVIVDAQSRNGEGDIVYPARAEEVITVRASIAKTAAGGCVVSATVLSVVISISAFNDVRSSDFSDGPVPFTASTVFFQTLSCRAVDRSSAAFVAL